MPTLTAPLPIVLDNRRTYIAFGLAWLLGHGSFFAAAGPDPLLPLPPWAPLAVLAGGMVIGTVIASVDGVRAMRGADRALTTANNLLSGMWVIGFAALAALITALSGVLGEPQVQTLLWPVGSGLVVGLVYLAGGAVHRDRLQYGLGAWLALVSTTALFLGTPSLSAVLALAGGGAFLLAAARERARRAAALSHRPTS